VKLAALAVRNIVNFSTAPLRLATLVGLVTGLVALIAAALFTVNRFVPSFRPFGYDINANAGTTTIVLYLSFIGSAILFCLGIMGEYMGVMIKEIKRRPVAVVAERTTEENPTPAHQ
jgi:dolichol-phosphate mannosyltransferase